MKSLKYWANAIAVDATYLLLFYWWTTGSEGAINVLLFFTWAVSIIGIVASTQVDLIAEAQEKSPRPKYFTAYHWATEAILCYALAWFGFFATAAIRLVMVLMFESSYKKAMENSKQQTGKRW